MTAERLPWFPCYPGALLGALSAMEPDEGYVYVVTLLRIYETGGPICDDDVTLARRTGLSRKRAAQMIERLRHTGKLIQTADGRLDNPVAAAEIEKQNALVKSRSETAAENAGKRWEKTKQIQRRTDAAALPAHNGGIAGAMPDDAHLHLHLPFKKESFVPSGEGTTAARPKPRTKKQRYDQPYTPDFKRLWAVYPLRAGDRDKREASVAFQIAVDNGADPERMIAAAGRYDEQMRAAGKINTDKVKMCVTWINKHCWDDIDDTPAPAAAPRKSSKFFVHLGTPAWAAWEKFYRATKGVGAPQTDLRWPDQDATLRRGWLFDTEYPPTAEQQFAEAA